MFLVPRYPRDDSRGKIRRTSMARDCLYCGLQFSDTTNFCPNCGRSTERDFIIHPQESELDRLRKEIQEKDDLIRQLVLTRTMPGEACSTGRRARCGSDGSRASATARFSGRS